MAEKEVPMGVAVIGGGVSGIAAALDLAHAGFKVYLIEQRQTLGGKVAELAECKIGLAPWLAEVENHPNIELLRGGTVEALSGTAGDFHLTVSGRVLAVASIILAVGYEIFENVSASYKLDHPDIVTTLDFERMLRVATKTGELTRPSNGRPVRKIGFIQCVGSRCTENELCSTVCCACTARGAKVVRQRFPGTEVALFYLDLRVFGRDEQLVDELKSDPGVRYIKSRVPEVIPCGSTVHGDISSGEPLLLKYENFAAGTIEQQAFDLVVIAVGLLPAKTLNELTAILGVTQDPFGYPATSATNPVETNVPGIFVCGCATGPMKVHDSIAQGSAAAMKAARFVKKRSDQHAETPEERASVGEPPRIGVFICGCEGEISTTIDIAALAERVRSHDNVVHVDTELTTCETAKEKITRGVRDHQLNRVVFAGCSPRASESFLSTACANAGLTPYSLGIANIREQCAWVHTREDATEVAGELIMMAIERVRLQPEEAIERYPVIPRALVIGGGVSGMTAALDIATAGYEVTLIENAPELGGALHTVDAFPTGERASDIYAQLKVEVTRNERVTVYTNAELTDWWGQPGAFTVRIRTAGNDVELGCGAVVVAIGSQLVSPRGWFGYGAAKNVVTQPEFAALLVSSAVANTIVMLLDAVQNEGVYPKYSSIELVTNAVRAKDCNPDAQIFVLYQEMKTYGTAELKYKEAREKGVIFVRYTRERPPELNAGIISVFDMVLGEELLIKPDLIVLSTPMVPSAGHEHLHELLGIPVNEHGFFMEARERPRMNFTPVDTPTRGVFVCGSALFPTSLEECVVQADAAASRACSMILAHEYLTSDPLIVRIDETLCRGCGLCAQVCGYNAIRLQESDGLPIATVKEAICQGCGACAVACPARAIKYRTSTLEQLTAMIEAIA
ncbi:MAG: FAD-dependent oxidoreductase [Candidatus Methanospirareceae archaeon]